MTECDLVIKEHELLLKQEVLAPVLELYYLPELILSNAILLLVLDDVDKCLLIFRNKDFLHLELGLDVWRFRNGHENLGQGSLNLALGSNLGN